MRSHAAMPLGSRQCSFLRLIAQALKEAVSVPSREDVWALLYSARLGRPVVSHRLILGTVRTRCFRPRSWMETSAQEMS